jgi:hypothetical protein
MFEMGDMLKTDRVSHTGFFAKDEIRQVQRSMQLIFPAGVSKHSRQQLFVVKTI